VDATDRERQRQRGAYYTPKVLADYLVDRTLGVGYEIGATVLDPACGDGALLTAAAEQIWRRHSLDSKSSPPADRAAPLSACLYGVDRDAGAIEQTNAALRSACGLTNPTVPVGRFVHGDALLDASAGVAGADLTLDWSAQFPESERGFDFVVANPPFINIRRLTKRHDAGVKDWLRKRYRTARGCYDLYVLFIERALELLRPGGRCGLIAPNKLATMEYAEPCRRMLLEQAKIVEIADTSTLRLFSADVYPYVIVFEKRAAQSDHRIRVLQPSADNELLDPPIVREVEQSSWTAATGFRVHGELAVEDRCPTAPLGDVAELASGASGFTAQKVARMLADRKGEPREGEWDFVVSGNIDRFRLRRGGVRYMKSHYQRPVLRENAEISNRKRQLYKSAKIILAGMSKRLEAVYVADPLALGVQAYAVSVDHTAQGGDAYYLLALLNSKLLSYLFSIRYRAKQLSGGFLSINKRQLEQLPVRLVDDEQSVRLSDQIRNAAEVLQRPALDQRRRRELDGEIDRAVYELYGLTADEIQQVERSVAAA
jgi:SAM-dependent methyltransferase